MPSRKSHHPFPQMDVEIGLDRITPDPNSVVTVGTFDGVHRGHRAIVRYLTRRAEKRSGRSTVVSFDPHPRQVVHGDPVPLLTTVEERAALLEELGLDRFVVIPFTNAFAQLQAVDYVEEVLLETVGLKEIVIGYDHRFGRGREGDRDLLESMGHEHGFSVDIIPPQVVNDDVVSSRDIRTLLQDGGAVEEAATMLGHRYALRGTVERGAGRGRKIGYPTANLDVIGAHKLVPRIGVYATIVEVTETGDRYGGMMNIGRRPTFEEMDVTAEVHILDYSGDLYGQTLRVEFLRRLRDEQKFDSVDALTMQLSEDETHCRKVVQTLA